MTSYYLVTNVEGSATPVKGDRAKIDKVLEEFRAKYKIQFYVWWRAEVQVKTANLDWSTKLAFGQMLTGPELLTYHEAGVRLHETERAFNSVLRGIAATQYQRDRTLKFRHDEAVDGKRLDDLFVDVEMRVIPGSSTRFPPIAEGGACRWLLDGDEEKAVLLRGAPGQGKSTLLQYACQVYRAAFLNDTDSFPHPRGVAGEPSTKRFAVRLDLRDYASWMTNQSRREKESSSEPRKNRKLKSFLTQHLEHTVDDQITREHIDRLFREIPVFLALDGLDEVGDPEVRRLVVEEVEAAAAELAATPWKSVVVVTTRPSYGQLAEPSGPLFTGVQLQPLSPKLTKEYIGKWASVSRKTEEDLATILSEFEERAREPYFTALTQNPMQLTVLLPLFHRFGHSTPKKRTDLYQAYMELFFDRESEKDARILRHRGDLEEVVPYLGWRLHSESEQAATEHRYTKQEMVKVIQKFLVDLDKETNIANDLFAGAWERIWVLTSRDERHFEFEVQSIREFFAAKFLYEIPERGGCSTAAILYEIAKREYWSNTARFMAGFVKPNELADLVSYLTDSSKPLDGSASRVLWNLLIDGVLQPRPREQVRLVNHLLGNPRTARSLADYVESEGIALPPQFGGSDVVSFVRDQAEAGVSSRALSQLEAAHASTEDFVGWWQPKLKAALTGGKASYWVQLGVERGAGSLVDPSVWDLLDLSDHELVRMAVRSGAAPSDDSRAAASLMKEVLDGEWKLNKRGVSSASDLARIAHPSLFLALAEGKSGDAVWDAKERLLVAKRALHPVVPSLHESMKGSRKGQKNTTAIWHNSVAALDREFGPTWLGGVVAVAGALSSFTTGGSTDRSRPPLGKNADFGQLIEAIRSKGRRPAWWLEMQRTHGDPLSQRVWALALLMCADIGVKEECQMALEGVLDGMDRHSFSRLREALRLFRGSSLLRQGTFSQPKHERLRLAVADMNVRPASGRKPQASSLEPVLAVSDREGWLAYLDS